MARRKITTGVTYDKQPYWKINTDTAKSILGFGFGWFSWEGRGGGGGGWGWGCYIPLVCTIYKQFISFFFLLNLWNEMVTLRNLSKDHNDPWAILDPEGNMSIWMKKITANHVHMLVCFQRRWIKQEMKGFQLYFLFQKKKKRLEEYTIHWKYMKHNNVAFSEARCQGFSPGTPVSSPPSSVNGSANKKKL